MLKNLFSDDAPQYVKITVSFLFIFVFVFYFQYIFSAWFYQDDFEFLYQYGYLNSLSLHELKTFENFGRFLSRNIYHFLTYKIIGLNAQMYFFINLGVLLLACKFLYNFSLNFFKDKTIAISAALLYFIMAPTIRNMSWICNIQHLLSHLFLFIFLFIYFKEENRKELTIKNTLLLLITFFCAINSHVIVIMILPSLALYEILYKNEVTISRTKIILFIVLSLISVFYMIKLSKYLAAGYSVEISLEAVIFTLKYYTRHLFFNIIIFIILALCSIILGVVKKDKMIIFLFLTSLLFYAMPAIMIDTKFINYVALSYFFFLILFIYIVVTYFKYKYFLVLLLIICVFYLSSSKIQLYSDKPVGSEIKTFLVKAKNIYQKEKLFTYKKICFKPANDITEKIDSRFEPYAKIPLFWHELMHGIPLKLFIDNKIDYKLYEEKECKNCPVVEVERMQRSLNENIVIDKVILPNE